MNGVNYFTVSSKRSAISTAANDILKGFKKIFCSMEVTVTLSKFIKSFFNKSCSEVVFYFCKPASNASITVLPTTKNTIVFSLIMVEFSVGQRNE
jgi:hypothetical protein